MRESRHGPWKMLLGGTVLGAALVLLAAAGMQFSDSRPSVPPVMSCDRPHSRTVAHRTPILRATNVTLPTICFKAKEGLRDVVANLQGRDAPLLARLETREVVNANCRACHRIANEDIMMAKPYCVDCHRGMAHQKKIPISFREAADE